MVFPGCGGELLTESWKMVWPGGWRRGQAGRPVCCPVIVHAIIQDITGRYFLNADGGFFPVLARRLTGWFWRRWRFGVFRPGKAPAPGWAEGGWRRLPFAADADGWWFELPAGKRSAYNPALRWDNLQITGSLGGRRRM